jgi:hypothetical protein
LILWLAGPNSNARKFAPAVLILPAIPIVKIVVYDSSQSLIHLFDFYFALVAAGVCMCIAFFLVYFSKFKDASQIGGMIVFALLGPTSLFMGLNALIQDYALTRSVSEGVVTRLYTLTNSKSGPEYQVTIETKRFRATAPTFKALNLGDRVRAEIGKGSNYIFKIERIPGAS